MIEPLSIGSLVALALSTATEAVVKGVAEEATKDAYKALKDKLSRLNSADVYALTESPTSVGRQKIVAELVERQPKSEQDTLRILAQTLASAMDKHASSGEVYPQWTAKLFTIRRGFFSVILSQNDEHHRIEYTCGFLSGSLQLDGTEVAKYWQAGRKERKFYIGTSQNNFLLRFFIGNFCDLSQIEIWVDGRPIFRTN